MGRAPCCEKNGLKKGPWTQEEDQKLMDYIQKYGYGKWRTLPKNAGLQRCGKSCRLRWTNYLRPDIKRGRFSSEEEQTIIQLHSMLGNKWSVIAARLPGRTDNEIKNYWNTNIRKRLLRMGIDPVTHSPRLGLLDLPLILTSSRYNPYEINNLSSRLLGVQEIWNCSTFTTPCVTFPNEAQVIEPNLEQFSSNFSDFRPVSCQLNERQSNEILPSNLGGEYLALLESGYCGSDQIVVDPPPSYQNSNFQSNKDSYLGFGSGLSTASSSPAPLD